MKKYSLIRKIYLYSFSLLGLILLIIGSVRLLNMGLKAFIFTKAEKIEQLGQIKPPSPLCPLKEVKSIKAGEKLTKDEKKAVDNWLEDYKIWQKESSGFNYLVAKRQKEASLDLSLIIVGLPLYLYHWLVIKNEIGEDSDDEERDENKNRKKVG